MIDQEVKYFNDHLNEWLPSNLGKIVVIKNQELVGFYNTFDEALSEAARRFGLDTYLIRQVIPNQEEIKIPALSFGVLNANLAYPIQR